MSGDWQWLKTSPSGAMVHALDPTAANLAMCGRKIRTGLGPVSAYLGTAGTLRCLKCLHRVNDESISTAVSEGEDALRVERERSVRLYQALVELIGMHRMHDTGVGSAAPQEWCHWIEPTTLPDYTSRDRILAVVHEEGEELAKAVETE